MFCALRTVPRQDLRSRQSRLICAGTSLFSQMLTTSCNCAPGLAGKSSRSAACRLPRSYHSRVGATLLAPVAPSSGISRFGHDNDGSSLTLFTNILRIFLRSRTLKLKHSVRELAQPATVSRLTGISGPVPVSQVRRTGTGHPSPPEADWQIVVQPAAWRLPGLSRRRPARRRSGGTVPPAS